MPRSKDKPYSHWDIPDPQRLVAIGSTPRRMVEAFQTHNMHEAKLSQPEAVARLIEAGYEQLVSSKPAGGTVRNRGGGAAPRTTKGRAGAAELRVDGNRYEQSGPKKQRSPDSRAA